MNPRADGGYPRRSAGVREFPLSVSVGRYLNCFVCQINSVDLFHNSLSNFTFEILKETFGMFFFSYFPSDMKPVIKMSVDSIKISISDKLSLKISSEVKKKKKK